MVASICDSERAVDIDCILLPYQFLIVMDFISLALFDDTLSYIMVQIDDLHARFKFNGLLLFSQTLLIQKSCIFMLL